MDTLLNIIQIKK